MRSFYDVKIERKGSTFYAILRIISDEYHIPLVKHKHKIDIRQSLHFIDTYLCSLYNLGELPFYNVMLLDIAEAMIEFNHSTAKTKDFILN